ncbi:MAG TPA: hypothetical protein VNS22_27975 [Geminicoccus sp.]|uniref:hypothetical protein n=1 Tax=Geminicoccus sp. TaxID=2024832 RepID=UPI002C43D1C3|nr:hypothetical protein [Geminicoccus sp.]HWL72197.1 hypothetical protein [Geminicoccus sp.]
MMDRRVTPPPGSSDLLAGKRPPGRRSGLAQRAARALAAALRHERPGIEIDGEGRVGHLHDLLVPTARLPADQHTILPDRPRTPVDDSLALTANCFLPWSRNPAGLRVGPLDGFQGLRFAARCPTGIRGTPPQTDLLLTGPSRVVGLVTRVTEHLTTPKTRIAEGYDQPMPEPHLGAWHELLVELRQTPQLFRLLDAVALAKHAIGLARTFPGQTTTLTYLFWEPSDARSHPVFAAHRAEVDLLRRRVVASGVPVLPLSLRELWDRWLAEQPGPALRDHVTALEARYHVAIGE